MFKIDLIMNSNQVETLVTLATYFRSAMMDEIKLPENAAKMPDLVKVDGFQMIKVSKKSGHYREVVEDIEKSLEAYAMQLNALMPQLINSQKKIAFKTVEKKSEVKATPARKVEEKKIVVDAETNIKTVKETKKETNVKSLMSTKESDTNKPIYGSLGAIPKINVKDIAYIVEAWKDAKGADKKATIYSKVQDLLNNYSMPLNVLRTDIHKFVNKQLKAYETENIETFEKELKAEGVSFDTVTDLSKIMSGEKLTSGKVKWVDKEDDFNLVLLTDAENTDDVDPQTFVKLWAMYYRTIGKEKLAVDILTKFYTNKEKGIIWSEEKARWFLNNLFRVNEFKELLYVIENILVYKQEKANDYKLGLPFAKSLLINYSIRTVVDNKTKEEKKVHWPSHKIDSFINRAVTGLRMSKLIKVDTKNTTIKYNVEYIELENGKFTGKFIGDKSIVKISNYDNLESFKDSCKVIGLNQARLKNPNIDAKSVIINFKNNTLGKEKTAGPVSVKKVETKDNSKDKVAVQAKSGNPKQDKTTEAPSKTVTVVKNKANKDLKNSKGYLSIQKSKEDLKQAKKDPVASPTMSNVKKKTMPNTKKTDKPAYAAIIVLEKDKTYTCTIKGFKEVVKTTGAKSVEEAKRDFIKALETYNIKIMEENDKARANHKKGKMLHMKPDFTEGELTFLLQSEKKTGTNN